VLLQLPARAGEFERAVTFFSPEACFGLKFSKNSLFLRWRDAVERNWFPNRIFSRQVQIGGLWPDLRDRFRPRLVSADLCCLWVWFQRPGCVWSRRYGVHRRERRRARSSPKAGAGAYRRERRRAGRAAPKAPKKISRDDKWVTCRPYPVSATKGSGVHLR